MYYVKNVRNGKEITDPALNLAIEYHLLNNVMLDEPILLFYINEPSIIIGRNQNTIEEINTEYVEKIIFILFAAFQEAELSIMILAYSVSVLLPKTMEIHFVTLVNLQNLLLILYTKWVLKELNWKAEMIY